MSDANHVTRLMLSKKKLKNKQKSLKFKENNNYSKFSLVD